MDKDTVNIIATATGAIITAALPFVRVHPLVALLFGVAAFFIVRELLTRRTPEKRPAVSPEPRETSLHDDQELVALVEQAARRFELLSRNMEPERTAHVARDIGRIVHALGTHFKENPSDMRLPAMQNFLYANLDHALRLVETYSKFSGRDASALPATQKRILHDAAEAINLTQQGFQALLEECRANDLLRMEAEALALTEMLAERFPHLNTMEQPPSTMEDAHPPADKGGGKGGEDPESPL